MIRSEWLILAVAAALVTAAIVLCGYIAVGSGQGEYQAGAVPFSLVLSQVTFLLSGTLAFTGLAAAVGVIFLRAARWSAAARSAEKGLSREL